MRSTVIQGIFPAGMRGGPATVQRLAATNAVPLPPHVMIGRGMGNPLPADIRQPMESFFGMRFDDVRIHVTPHANAIGALAFTQGSDIHFAPGHYNPSTAHGQTMLAHELAHVVQQKSGRVRNPFGNGVAIVQDRTLEAEAERLARGAIAACAQAKLATGVMQLRASDKHFRHKAWANNWLSLYGRKSNMKDSWYNHIFKGVPFDGTARKKAKPTGFHAYGDQPGYIDIQRTVGRTGTFHTVYWLYDDSPHGTTEKMSSMFPDSLSVAQVIALVLMDTKEAWVAEPDEFPPKAYGKTVTADMLSKAFGINRAWTMVKTGDTVYPRPA